MTLKSWNDLPEFLQNDIIKPYYEILSKRKTSLFCKRIFDIAASFALIVLLSPLFLILSLAIKIDSNGPVFFRQERVTQYGKIFRIFKFRTMVVNAEKIGTQVTIADDARITKVGAFIRRCRLDEIPQLFNILTGDMTFVGTRPEVPKYVNAYTPEMLATLLLPAGVTSLASILYKDEAKLIDAADDSDKVYIEKILPVKMYYNIKSIEEFRFWGDIRTMCMTVFAVCGKKYKGDYFSNENNEVEMVIK